MGPCGAAAALAGAPAAKLMNRQLKSALPTALYFQRTINAAFSTTNRSTGVLVDQAPRARGHPSVPKERWIDLSRRSESDALRIAPPSRSAARQATGPRTVAGNACGAGLSLCSSPCGRCRAVVKSPVTIVHDRKVLGFRSPDLPLDFALLGIFASTFRSCAPRRA